MKQRTRLAAAAEYNLEKKYGEGIEVVRTRSLREGREGAQGSVVPRQKVRGLKASRAATLRRGMRGFGRCVTPSKIYTDGHRAALQVRSSSERRRQVAAVQLWFEKAKMGVIVDKHNEKMAPTRNARDLKAALSYWSAEATWRIERQRWMWRQVRYMRTSSKRCSIRRATASGSQGGCSLCRRQRGPHAGLAKWSSAPGEQAAISRSTTRSAARSTRLVTAIVARASAATNTGRRGRAWTALSASVRAAATAQRRRAAGLRVLAPDIDSYLEEYTPKTRTTGGGMQAMSMSDRSARRSMTGRMTGRAAPTKMRASGEAESEDE